MFLVKSGACSIILGSGHYGSYYPIKKKKLLKITKISENHNEIKYLDEIRKIQNYSNYYAIPDRESFILDPAEDFYKYIKDLVKKDELSIFTGPLECFYVDNAGDKDILDTLNDLIINNDKSVWSSYKTILNFTKQIMGALRFLHQNNICHLDIKPENIMVDVYNRKFKLIDFGFASKEPFDDYLRYIRGTPGYFPANFADYKVNEWLPKIEANDLSLVNNEFPMKTNRKLVYKIDSYCFGRVLFYIKYIYTDKRTNSCFNMCSDTQTIITLNDIIANLIESDVYKRSTIEQCMYTYF